jgi:hypothetical protein
MNIDIVARAIHDGWWQFMLMHGWRLGPRNQKAKTHPHLVHWELLDDHDRDQDIFIALTLIRGADDLTTVTPKDIHEAWRVYEGKRPHPHNLPFAQAHPLNSGEHWLQSILVRRLARKLKPTPGENLTNSVRSITNMLNGFAHGLRAHPEVITDPDEMVELNHAIDNAQNACIELGRAASVCHTLWLANVNPELLARPTDWMKHEQEVKAYIKKHAATEDLPAVLSDIDVTP